MTKRTLSNFVQFDITKLLYTFLKIIFSFNLYVANEQWFTLMFKLQVATRTAIRRIKN